jgi:hypothetical protein
MPDALLDVTDAVARVALVPNAVEFLGSGPELDHEVAGKVLGLSLAPFLAPQPHQGRFVAAHNDVSIGAADEPASINR